MSEPAFPVWITKWCLSSGIEEATGWPFPGNPLWLVVASGRLKGAIMQDGQWFRTKKAAVKDANKLLRRVIEQQRQRLEELESIVFDGGEDEGTGDGAGESAGGDEARPQG